MLQRSREVREVRGARRGFCLRLLRRIHCLARSAEDALYEGAVESYDEWRRRRRRRRRRREREYKYGNNEWWCWWWCPGDVNDDSDKLPKETYSTDHSHATTSTTIIPIRINTPTTSFKYNTKRNTKTRNISNNNRTYRHNIPQLASPRSQRQNRRTQNRRLRSHSHREPHRARSGRLAGAVMVPLLRRVHVRGPGRG